MRLWCSSREQQLVCASCCVHCSCRSPTLGVAVPQGWTNHATHQTHRPLLMMSFLHRLAFKSVMAAKKESIAKRMELDDQMEQTLRRLIPPESLLRLNPRLPSRKSRVEPCCSASSKTTRLSQLFFLNGTQEPQITRCTTILPTPRSVPPVVLIRGALSRHVVFRQPSILYYGPCWQTFADSLTQVPSSSPTWTTGTLGSSRNTCYKTFVLIATATRSVNLELQPSKIQTWRAPCQDPIHAEQNHTQLSWRTPLN